MPLSLRNDKTKNADSCESAFLCMCYKKDIIAVFAYEFELLLKIMKFLLMQG